MDVMCRSADDLPGRLTAARGGFDPMSGRPTAAKGEFDLMSGRAAGSLG